MVKVDENNYKEEYVPSNPYGEEKLDIEVWIDILDVVEVNEPEVQQFFRSYPKKITWVCFSVSDVLFIEIQIVVEMD